MRADINSVLIEGVLMDCKGKKDKTGWWLVIRSKGSETQRPARVTMRIDVPLEMESKVTPALDQGTKVRVVGRLERASRIGAFVKAQHLEIRPVMGVVT